jgi:hypothetical protein
MSLTTDYRTMINRGRKAGLTTQEIYTALATHPSDRGPLGSADPNGFVSGYNQQGQRVYRPVGSYPRP